MLLLLLAPAHAGEVVRPQVHHDLAVVLRPDRGDVQATDTLTLPGGLEGLERGANGALRLSLHPALTLSAGDPAWEIAALPPARNAPDTPRTWDVRPASGTWPSPVAIPLRWSGTVRGTPVAEKEEYARSFARSRGTIGTDGVFLAGETAWVPSAGEKRVAFRLQVDLPSGWDAVSQGKRVARTAEDAGTRVVWDCPHPMEEVWLVANRFTLVERRAGDLHAMAYLRTPDPGLAAKYLDATVQYVAMYAGLIGPYPFEKFALVENFWETGYGMPSFTLLGPQVIRLPFILHSSYPHEILHNWWGNSVYVDWEKGNWCEGLTAYMADHLVREGQGRGAEYRLDTLKKYRSYVRASGDFPLREFRSRHSGVTEAVGYGKALMVFHMLRRRVGDDVFRDALRRFYDGNRWRTASYADLARAFSETTKEDWAAWFGTWVDRAGAPVLRHEVEDLGSRVRITVRQVQEGEPFPLRVPVAVTLEGQPAARVVDVALSGPAASVEVEGVALRVDVDPEYDVFRRLDVAEVPPTLGQVFGADRVTIVVPSAKDPLAEGWRAVAEGWKDGGDVAIAAEDALDALPSDRAVWVLGSENRWAPRAGIAPATVTAEQVDFGETRVPRAGHSFAFVARHPANEELAVGWIGADSAAALPGLARKLPHYGKYSWLAFSGDEPTNVAKGTGTATASPLVTVLRAGPDGKPPPRGALPAREPLARLAPTFDEERLLGHVRWLADDAREGRGLGSKGLDDATAYVAKAFEEAGLAPGGDEGTWFQTFTEPGGPDGKPVTARNVVGVLRGTNPAWARQSVVLGAHVDHLGRGWPDVRAGNEGKIHNGADDNASGVAVLIEVARALAAEPRPRTVVFVAFSAEEWGLKGSRHYVRAMRRWPITEARSMVNMDCVGRLGAQKLQVLGTGGAREWPHVVMGVGHVTGVEATAVPEDPQGSDQVAFREAGVPAVHVFSGAHEDYHRATDDVEKIDAAGMAKVAAFVRETVDYLAQRPDPLTPAGTAPKAGGPAEGGRRVLLGTMPDFAHQGPGVLVASVVEGSPAAAAGLQPGDLLLALGGTPLADLRAYSEALKRHAPGDVVRLRWKRGGQEMEKDVTLVAR
jgi:hypothetical protein